MVDRVLLGSYLCGCQGVAIVYFRHWYAVAMVLTVVAKTLLQCSEFKCIVMWFLGCSE